MKSPCLSILQLSDLHVLPSFEDKLLGVQTERYFHEVLTHAFNERESYDVLLLTGDLAQSPCVESYQRILQKVKEYNIPTLCLPGNHDDYALMQQIFNTPQMTYQKQTCFDKWQIILLNSQVFCSEIGRLDEHELDFLETCLKERSDLFALIAVHHNCLPTGSIWLDTMTIQNSSAFLEIVARYPNAKVITNGHIHQKMSKKIGDILVLGTPSTCFQFSVNSADFSMDRTPPGYRIMDLYSDGTIDTSIQRIDSKMLELELNSEGY